MIYYYSHTKTLLVFILAWVTFVYSVTSHAEASINLQIQIPAIDTSPYHRPYIAVWLETPKRKGIATLGIWYDDDEWLKDLRQWWRKLGRRNRSVYDSVTGATKKPGTYNLIWNGLDNKGNPVPAGEYFLNVEAAREAGGRDFLRQKIFWKQPPEKAQRQEYSLPGTLELGAIKITVEHP